MDDDFDWKVKWRLLFVGRCIRVVVAVNNEEDDDDKGGENAHAIDGSSSSAAVLMVMMVTIIVIIVPNPKNGRLCGCWWWWWGVMLLKSNLPGLDWGRGHKYSKKRVDSSDEDYLLLTYEYRNQKLILSKQ